MRPIITLFLFLIIQATALAQLSGSITVCNSGCDYSSLTASGGLFQDLNDFGINGNLIVSIQSDLTENGDVVLGAYEDENGPHTITIQPDGNITRTISGTNNGDGILAFLGAYRMIIDGRDPGDNSTSYSNRHLIIRNTSLTAPTISIGSDAVSCAIRFALIEGSYATGGVMEVGGGNTSGNDDLTIEYCDIHEAGANLPMNGISMTGGPAGVNDNIRISYNHIYNFFPKDNTGGYGINIGNYNGSVSIEGNSIYQQADRSLGPSYPYAAIKISSASGSPSFKIKNNFIGGTAENCGGSVNTISATAGFATLNLIHLEEVGFTTATEVSGNTIMRVASAGLGSASYAEGRLSGITLNRGSFEVRNNYIGIDASETAGGLTASFDASGLASGGLVAGISLITNTSGTGVKASIEGNRIDALTIDINGTVSSLASEAAGIYIDQQTDLQAVLIKKNIIGNLSGPVRITTNTSSTTPLSTVGIDIARATASLTLDQNKIAHLESNGQAPGSYVRGISASAAASISITQSQIYNLQSASNTPAAVSAAGIYADHASMVALAIKRNLIYDIDNSNSNPQWIAGIVIGATGSGVTPQVENNMITLGHLLTADKQLYGIYQHSTSSLQLYANSVAITGGNAGNAGKSYCFYRDVTSTIDAKANLLFNNRAGATTTQFSIGTATASGWSGTSSSNNMLYSADAVGDFASTNCATLTDWQTASGGDANSTSSDVSSSFDLPIGDLRIPAGSANEAAVIDLGSNVVTDDIDGAHRVGLVDIGASEVLVNWLGLSTDWHDANNWSTGTVPACGGLDAIKIGAGVPNQPTITSAAQFKELVVLANATLTIAATGSLEQCTTAVSPYSLVVNGSVIAQGSPQITLYGDFYQNNSFTNSTGTLLLSGTNTQTIDGDDNIIQLNNVVIDGGGAKVLNQEVRISGNLALNNGLINSTAANVLTFTTTGTYTGGNTSSYINGPSAKQTNSTALFMFPVGKGGKMRQAGIKPSNTTSSTFTAEYFDGSATTAFGSTKGTAIINVSNIEYWIINRSGAANGAIHLTWDAQSDVSANAADRAQLRVVRWSGSSWENRGSASITGDQNAGTVISNNITAFSPFTLGSSSENNPLPIELDKFEAHPVGTQVKLSWQTLSELNNDYFSVEVSTNGEKFTEIIKVQGSGSTNEHNYYTAWDPNPHQGISYYRLRQVDLDGQFTYSKVVKVDVQNTLAPRLVVSPNPVSSGQFTVHLAAFGSKAPVKIQIIDLSGRSVGEFTGVCGPAGTAEFTVDKTLQPGLYVLRAMSHTVKQTKIVVR